MVKTTQFFILFFVTSFYSAFAQYIPVTTIDPYPGLPYKPKVQKEYSWDSEASEWVLSETQYFSYNWAGAVTGISIFDEESGIFISRDSFAYDQKNRLAESFQWELSEETNELTLVSKNVNCYDANNQSCGYSSYNINPETNLFELNDGMSIRYTNGASADSLIYKIYDNENGLYKNWMTVVKEKNNNAEIISNTTYVNYDTTDQLSPFTRTIYDGWNTPSVPKETTEQIYLAGIWTDQRKTVISKEGDLWVELIDSLKGENFNYRNIYSADSSVHELEKLAGGNWMLIYSSSTEGDITTTIRNAVDAKGVLLSSEKVEEETTDWSLPSRTTTYQKTGQGVYVKTEEEITEYTKNEQGYLIEFIETYWSLEEGLQNESKTVLSDFTVVTSTQNATEIKGLSVYPNPSNGNFNILSTDGSTGKYEVLDSKGEVVRTGNIEDGFLSLENETQGLYLLKYQSGNIIRTVRMIKK